MTCRRLCLTFTTRLLLVVGLSAWVATPARADPMVTYDWVTDSPIGMAPTTASFQVPLSVVQSGMITQTDITNIQFSFPGIDPLPYTTPSSIGLDNTAFVDPTTGLPIFHDANQGLAVAAYHDQLFGNVFLSILFDYPGGDTYNAINGGPGSLGRGSGHWTALVPKVPEPGSLVLLTCGVLSVLGYSRRRMRAGADPDRTCSPSGQG